MHRLDVGGGLRIVAQRLPQEADRLGERGVGDKRLLPDRVDDFLARHDGPGALEEELEDAEHARRQGNLIGPAAQQPGGPVEREGPECDGGRLF